MRLLPHGAITMMEIFVVQFLAAGLGAASTALADYSYRRSRINQRTHCLWVATSTAVICLPVLVWACDVFLGPGVFGRIVAGVVFVAVFFWVYRTLRRERSPQELTSPHSSALSRSTAVSTAKFHR
jgi:hypothetical protein